MSDSGNESETTQEKKTDCSGKERKKRLRQRKMFLGVISPRLRGRPSKLTRSEQTVILKRLYGLLDEGTFPRISWLIELV
jgi:hypothetical protein